MAKDYRFILKYGTKDFAIGDNVKIKFYGGDIITGEIIKFNLGSVSEEIIIRTEGKEKEVVLFEAMSMTKIKK